MVPNLVDESRALQQHLSEIRRDLHRHPELSFKEVRTARKIADYLSSLGYEVTTGVAQTGVIGILSGCSEGPTIAIRADIDALPVTELTGAPYASEIPGVMHACGHDVHTTCALGASRLLANHRGELKGKVKVVFQPAEEINAGAKELIKSGILENPKVDMIFGLHNHPEVPAGKVAIKEGPLMAAVDTIKISVTGKGGHGALPHRNIDPVVASAAIIINLQTVVSRNVDPQEPAVVTIGTIHGGTANNVIPDTVEMTGTVRTFNPAVREKMEGWLRRVVEGTAQSLGSKAELYYRYDLPPVLNHPEATSIAKKAISLIAGEEGIVVPVPSMGGEDFALFQEKVPGCFFWLGVGNSERGIVHPWHSPLFDVDESALPVGAGVLAQCVLLAAERLSEGS